jgi:hypothetical protein
MSVREWEEVQEVLRSIELRVTPILGEAGRAAHVLRSGEVPSAPELVAASPGGPQGRIPVSAADGIDMGKPRRSS